MRIRAGRRNPHTLYLQVGDEPSEDDLRIGFMIDPTEAAFLADAEISATHLDEIRAHARLRIDDGR